MKKLIKTAAAAILSMIPSSTNPPSEDVDPIDGSIKKEGTHVPKKTKKIKDEVTSNKEKLVEDRDFVLPTEAEMAEIISKLDIDVEHTDVMFGYKTEDNKIVFYNDHGEDVFCIAMNTNDDKINLNTESSGPRSGIQDNPDFIDGGWTNGMSFGCITTLGESEFNAVFKHDMYTAQTNYDTGEEVANQRSAGGEFSLTFGQKTNLFDSDGATIDNYWETKLGYREVNVTESIQDAVHSFAGVAERDYQTDPLEEGLSIDASVGFSAKFKFKIADDLKVSSGPFVGITEGDYSGDVAGYKFSFGTGRGKYDTGIPFKTDTSSLFYGGTGLNKAGDWELEITTGVRNTRDDSRFGDNQFKEDTKFTNINMIRQISDNIFVITGVGFADNPAQEGSEKVNSYSIGIGFTPGKKPKKVRRDDTEQDNNEPEMQQQEEDDVRIPFIKGYKGPSDDGFSR